jgi:NAD(P)-dependent dehydrogenase (short-subunit alcohol dehydrogenase family)
MSEQFLAQLFSLEGKVAIVTGATGVLGGAMARGLAQAGAKVGVLGRRAALAEQVAAEISAAGGEGLALPADVLQIDQLRKVYDTVMARWGRIDILVNAAGGNTPTAIVAPDQHFFDLPMEAMQPILDLNLNGTLLPCQVFGKVMAEQHQGCIINISSMAVARAMTRTVAYSAAKAAVENFTRWLAVEMALKYGIGVRVNAIAPGYFIGEQNRRLLLNEDNTLTPRGQAIIRGTPAGRFGEPHELVSTLIWLCGPGAGFVTGVTVPVDGGFSAFTGI